MPVRTRWMLVVLAACTGQPRTAATPSGSGAVSATETEVADVGISAIGGPVTPATICARVAELRHKQCRAVERYALSEAECRDDVERSLETRGPDARTAKHAQGRCMLDHASCDAIAGCLAALDAAADEMDGTPTRLRTCKQTEVFAPVGLARARWERRRGAGARRYADVATTKARPVEVCGKPAQAEWLTTVTCRDGSRPFPSSSHARAARLRNVGRGGRCSSIIDLFAVPCPEGTYKIYIDAYVCPQD
jgi:hypothetical protein